MSDANCSVEGCERGVHGWGWCSMHYDRWRRHGTTDDLGISTVERFLLKVNKHGPIPVHRPDLGHCWLWTAAVGANGYGSFSAGRQVDGNVSAHRWSYTHHVGPIPEGLQLDHLCRMRACVNPGHLEPVTPRENILRGDSPLLSGARQLAKTHCPRGHPYDDENTYRSPNGDRLCRTCRRDRRPDERRRRGKRKTA